MKRPPYTSKCIVIQKTFWPVLRVTGLGKEDGEIAILRCHFSSSSIMRSKSTGRQPFLVFRGLGQKRERVSKLVFYAQSTGAVISGRYTSHIVYLIFNNVWREREKKKEKKETGLNWIYSLRVGQWRACRVWGERETLVAEKSGSAETCDCLVTCLAASTGLLWIGTNVGLILTLPLPRLNDGVPLYRGRPSVAYHAHRGPVRYR